MRVLDPIADQDTPRVFQSGTVNDGARALASACAALRLYRGLDAKGAYQVLEQRTRRVGEVIQQHFRSAGFPCQVNQLASMLQIHLGANEMSFSSVQGRDARMLELFYLALINHGVLLSLPTSNHVYLSFLHTDDDIEIMTQTIAHVFDRYDFAAAACR